MILDRVTITGADDNTNPADLIATSAVFPWVEWGILVSRSRVGTPRYPSIGWMEGLVRAIELVKVDIKLSVHVCGAYVRDALLWGSPDVTGVPIWSLAKRVQWNFHAEPFGYRPEGFRKVLLPDKQYIFQIDGTQNHLIFDSVLRMDVDAVPLFDTSGGAGQLPYSWPMALFQKNGQKLYHGYAGGLGPDTLAGELPKIEQMAGDARIWIDMEGRVRTNEILDMTKVMRVLEFCDSNLR